MILRAENIVTKYRKRTVVKGVNFVNLIDAGDPVEQAKAYELVRTELIEKI